MPLGYLRRIEMAQITKATAPGQKGWGAQPAAEAAAVDAETELYDDTLEDELVEEGTSSNAGPFKRFITSPYLTLISRIVLGSIFVLSGMTKLTSASTFRTSILSYEVPLPDFVVQLMVTTLPVIELGIGIWILAGLFTRFAAGIAGGLTLIFMVAIGQAWARGIEADCGCFAAGAGTTTFAQQVMDKLGPIGTFLQDAQIGPIPLLRDALFVLMAAHLILVPTVFSLDRLRNRGREQELLAEAE